MHWPSWPLFQKYEIGLHWNRVMKKKMKPAAALMAMATYMIHLWSLSKTMRRRKMPIEILDAIMAME